MIVLKEWKKKENVLGNEEGKMCLESKWKKATRVVNEAMKGSQLYNLKG